MAEDKSRNRVPSSDSARERNAGFRPQGPAVARIGFFNGLLCKGSGHRCPGTMGFSEMTFEKWFEMAILYGSDPDNENQVAIGSRLRITVNTVNSAYFVFSRLSPFSYSRILVFSRF